MHRRGRQISRRQMPRIYGNLQPQRRDWRPFFQTLSRLILILGALSVIYGLFFGPLFRVRTVEVQGVTLSNPDVIRAAVPVGGSMWQLPTARIEQAITKTEPVESLEVLRGLPSSVRVVVHERQPVIAWVSANTVTLVDTQGTAFLQYAADAVPAPETAIGKKIASLIHIVDTQNLPVEMDSQVTGAVLVQFVQQTLKNFSTYVPDIVWDKAEVGTTLYDITFISNTGMSVHMNTLGDSGIEVRNLARLIQAGDVKPTSSVDLRIDRWAYVHE